MDYRDLTCGTFTCRSQSTSLCPDASRHLRFLYAYLDQEEGVNFIHRMFSAPVLSSFREAVNRGHLRSIPGFESLEMLTRHPMPLTLLSVIWQFTASTHVQDASDHETFYPPAKTGPAEKSVPSILP
jgi:hypothetical protein